MNKSIFLTPLVLLICLLLPEYSSSNEEIKLPPKKISLIEAECVSATHTKNNLTVCIKTLKKSDLRRSFGFATEFIYNLSLDNSIIPMHLTIKNNSTELCSVEPKDINATILSYEEMFALSTRKAPIEEQIKPQKKIIQITSIIGGVIGGFFGFLLPAVLHTSSDPLSLTAYAIPIAIGAGIGLAGGILFGIYSALYFTVGQGAISFFKNIHIKRVIKKNTLHKKVMIKPGREYSACIFLQKSDIIPSISIHSKNKNKTITPFDLDLLVSQ